MTFHHVHEEDFMTVIIGIDPHKATHMAVAIDGDEQRDRAARGAGGSRADATAVGVGRAAG